MAVLRRELNTLYATCAHGAGTTGDVLPPLSVQYADFAIWQRKWLSDDLFRSQIEYWRKRLENVPVLRLPLARARPAMVSHRGGVISRKRWSGHGQ